VYILLAIAWVVGTVYATIPMFWLAIHPLTGFWRRRGSAYRYLLPFWALVIAAFLVLTYPWFPKQLYRTWVALIPATVCFIGSMSTYRRISRDFGHALVIGQAELEPAKHEQKLVTTGIHGRIRHPFYLGHLLMLLAFTVGSGLLVLYVLTGFAVVSGAVMIWLEDRELERRFGDEYREYRGRVSAILPISRGSS
jgi:protein-S-isoprenylcysteine O-methyltransferase Ste14